MAESYFMDSGLPEDNSNPIDFMGYGVPQGNPGLFSDFILDGYFHMDPPHMADCASLYLKFEECLYCNSPAFQEDPINGMPLPEATARMENDFAFVPGTHASPPATISPLGTEQSVQQPRGFGAQSTHERSPASSIVSANRIEGSHSLRNGSMSNFGEGSEGWWSASESSDQVIPALFLPERNYEPRNVPALVDQTQFGGHRSLAPGPPPATTIPAPPGTLSEASSSRRSVRRKGNALHDRNLPHHCKICPCTFAAVDGLRRHVARTHIDMKDRPHGCTIPKCDRRFNCPREVQRHEATHQAERVKIPCPLCDHAGFTRGDNLGRHILAAHP